MGLNYNYLLYFKRKNLWKALQAVADMAEPFNDQPTTIHFTDHDLVFPLMSDFGKKTEIQYNAAELSFDISLIFEEDDAIFDYIALRGGTEFYRAPPDPDGINRVAIGFIYLTIYADLSKHWAFEKETDLVLFEFGTTGTRMSLLFSDSESIRKAFISLLEKVPGECGIFDRENDSGELFWLHGRQLNEYISDKYMNLEEMEEAIKRGW